MKDSNRDTTTTSSRVTTGSLWALMGFLQKGLLAIATSMFLARLLTPDDLGAYFLIVSLVSMVAAGAQLGLHRAVVRFVAEAIGKGDEGKARNVIALTFQWGTGGGLLAAAVVFLGGGEWVARVLFESTAMQAASALAAFGVLAIVLQNLIAETLRGFHDIRSATIFGGLLAALLVVAVLLVLWSVAGKATLGTAVGIWVGSAFASSVIGGLVLWRRFATLPMGGDSPARELRAAAGPLWVNGLLAIGVSEIGIWVVGAAGSTQDAALFGAAARISIFITFPLIVVNAVIPPIVAELYSLGRRDALQSTLRGSATLALLPSMAFFAVLVIWAGSTLEVLYGAFYREASTILVVLCLGQLANVWSGPCGFALMMTGNQRILMWITVAYGALTLFGSLMLVKPFGPVGVATALAVALALRSAAMVLALRVAVNVWSYAGLNAREAIHLLRSA